jgi:hypothetical protein
MIRSRNRLTFGASAAFRTLVPRTEDRTPISLKAIPVFICCCIPFLFLAYLSRRPDTYLIRLLLLPAVIVTTLGPAYRYVWLTPQLNVYNWGQCLFAEVFAVKALELALRPEGMLKEGEIQPGELQESIVTDGVDGGRRTAAQIRPTNDHILPAWLYDAFEVTYAFRGTGWVFGKYTHVPKEFRPKEFAPFFRATLQSFLRNFLILDFLESLLKLFPGVGDPMGGSIFYPELPPFQRYLVSTTIHMLTGSCLLAGFQMVYDLITLTSISFGSSTSSWPPIMDDPWSAESMHIFWGKRWHQQLRHTFVVFGGLPGKWLAGNLGAVFGTFIASGLYHECAIYAMGRGWDNGVILFFALQGPVLVLERVWRRVTGRRVGGWGGRLWVYFMMFVLAQPLVDSWHQRGLGGGMVVPPFISPTRLVLLPVFRRLISH